MGLDALRNEGKDIVKREAEAPVMTKEITYPYDTSGLYYSSASRTNGDTRTRQAPLRRIPSLKTLNSIHLSPHHHCATS
jgi:hypothetical protein